MPFDDPNTWTPEDLIKQQQALGKQFYRTPSGPTPWDAFARGLGGLFSGMANTNAAVGIENNQNVMRGALKNAAEAKSSDALARTMIGSGIPQLGEQGVGLLSHNMRTLEAQNTPLARAQLAAQQQALKAAQQSYTHAQQVNPLNVDILNEQLKAARQKDSVREFTNSILRDDAPAAEPPPTPGVKPMSNDVAPGDPNLILAQTQNSRPQPPAPQQNLRAIIKSRPLAEQQLFALMLSQDPKKAMDMVKEWTDPKLNKTTEHDLDKALMGSIQSVARLQETQKSFKPEFLQGGTQVGIGLNTMRDKFLTGKLKPNPQEMAQLNQYHAWRSTAWNQLNAHIKELAGSAVTGNELERALREMPNPGTGWADGDSPAAYQAKMDATIRNSKMAIARYRYLRENGILKGGEMMKGREDLGRQFPLDQMPKIIDQEGDKTLKRMRMENPGKSDQELLPKAMEEVSKRFGLSI